MTLIYFLNRANLELRHLYGLLDLLEEDKVQPHGLRSHMGKYMSFPIIHSSLANYGTLFVGRVFINS